MLGYLTAGPADTHTHAHSHTHATDEYARHKETGHAHERFTHFLKARHEIGGMRQDFGRLPTCPRPGPQPSGTECTGRQVTMPGFWNAPAPRKSLSADEDGCDRKQPSPSPLVRLVATRGGHLDVIMATDTHTPYDHSQ